jgi:hypothetical protein
MQRDPNRAAHADTLSPCVLLVSGPDFSRAVETRKIWLLAPEVYIYGTAEAVPFVPSVSRNFSPSISRAIPRQTRNAIIRLPHRSFFLAVQDRRLRYTSIGNRLYGCAASCNGNEAISYQLGHHARGFVCRRNCVCPESAGLSKPALARDHAGDAARALGARRCS